MRAEAGMPELQVLKKSESKLLDRTYVETLMEVKGGKLARKDAIEMVAKEMGVQSERVGLVRLKGQSGTTKVFGEFYVYGSQDSKKLTHPKHLEVRLLSKEEREKLKQAKKKQTAAAPAAEAKK
jgi:ribosomal protein S24E